jgi:antitoxin (DNA-binding transcriptional repressor) of toxin-antitoxin stability system
MESVNIHHAKTHLSAILTQIEEQGKSFLVCRHGKPIAELVPHRKKTRLKPHPIMGQVQFHYDPTEPLSEDEWPTDQ